MSKKPAKTPNDYINKKEDIVGKPVLYIGMGEKIFTCPTCSRSFSKGMIYEHATLAYCSRRCITV
jgi:hypothetical protein